jgi:hypothetical protein
MCLECKENVEDKGAAPYLVAPIITFFLIDAATIPATRHFVFVGRLREAGRAKGWV